MRLRRMAWVTVAASGLLLGCSSDDHELGGSGGQAGSGGSTGGASGSGGLAGGGTGGLAGGGTGGLAGGGAGGLAGGGSGGLGGGGGNEAACVNSGGVVSSSLCCKAAGDFPNTCLVGACGCAPSASENVTVCDCPSGSCWDGSTCAPSGLGGAGGGGGAGGTAASCVNSGGTVQTALCCKSAGDFPATCGVGACSCSPSNSENVQQCVCPSGKCFDGSQCI